MLDFVDLAEVPRPMDRSAGFDSAGCNSLLCLDLLGMLARRDSSFLLDPRCRRLLTEHCAAPVDPFQRLRIALLGRGGRSVGADEVRHLLRMVGAGVSEERRP